MTADLSGKHDLAILRVEQVRFPVAVCAGQIPAAAGNRSAASDIKAMSNALLLGDQIPGWPGNT
jgi:hypothetical protein